jgi:hypothetical protein
MSSCSLSYLAIDIFPETDIHLSGFGARHAKTPTLGVEECMLRVVWCRDSEGSDLIIFSADLLYFPSILADELSSLLDRVLGVSRSKILFTATHTHSAPTFGFFPWETVDDEYLAMILQRVEEALPQLCSGFLERQMHFACLSHTEAVTVNRRSFRRDLKSLFFTKRTLAVPNYDVRASQEMNVLVFTDFQGVPDLVIMNFPCHPVLNINMKISSDFPGTVIQNLKKKEICKEAIFIQGFSGDLRPNITTRVPNLKLGIKQFVLDVIKILVYGRIFIRHSGKRFEVFTDEITILASKAVQKSLSSEKLKVKFSFREQSLEIYSETGKTSEFLYLKRVNIAHNLAMLAVSAEVLSEYYNRIREIKSPYIIPVSVTDRVFGYLPGKTDSPFGGYEVDKAAENIGLDAPICQKSLVETENLMTNLASKISKE